VRLTSLQRGTQEPKHAKKSSIEKNNRRKRMTRSQRPGAQAEAIIAKEKPMEERFAATLKLPSFRAFVATGSQPCEMTAPSVYRRTSSAASLRNSAPRAGSGS